MGMDSGAWRLSVVLRGHPTWLQHVRAAAAATETHRCDIAAGGFPPPPICLRQRLRAPLLSPAPPPSVQRSSVDPRRYRSRRGKLRSTAMTAEAVAPCARGAAPAAGL
eukprot:364867-Chlamydomonas_euryale.AAC.3